MIALILVPPPRPPAGDPPRRRRVDWSDGPARRWIAAALLACGVAFACLRALP